MDRLLEWVVKGFFILIFGPLLLALVIHSLVALLGLSGKIDFQEKAKQIKTSLRHIIAEYKIPKRMGAL